MPEALRKQRKSLGHVARTSVMWGYARTGFTSLIAIPTAVVLARLLSPAEFGVAAAAVFFGRLAGKLSNAGMGVALIRVKDLRPDHVSTVFVVNCAFGLLGFLALAGSGPWIGRFYGNADVGWIMPVVALNFVVGTFSMIPQALLSRDMRYREMAIGASMDTVVGSVVACALAFSGFSYWSLVLGDLSGGVIKWVYAVSIVGWQFRFRFVRSAADEIGSFALGSYAKRMLEYLTQNVDNLVIGRLLGITALGFYDKAFQSVNKVLNYLTVVGPSVSLRVFSIIQDEPERFRRAYRKVITTVTLFGYTALAGVMAVAPNLIVVAFGERWRPSVLPFQLLCVAAMFKLQSIFASSASQARGWIWSQVWRQVVQVVLVVVGVYLASPWGIVGAAAAVLLATLVYFGLMQGLMLRATRMGVRDLIEPQLPGLLSSVTLFAVLLAADTVLRRWRIENDLAVLAGQLLIGAVVVLVLVRACPFPEVRLLLHEIAEDVPPGLAKAVLGRPPVSANMSTV